MRAPTDDAVMTPPHRQSWLVALARDYPDYGLHLGAWAAHLVCRERVPADRAHRILRSAADRAARTRRAFGEVVEGELRQGSVRAAPARARGLVLR